MNHETVETAIMPGVGVPADVEERAREVFRQRVIEPRVYSDDQDENGRYVEPGLENAWQAFRLGYVEGDAQHAAEPMLQYFRAQEQTRTAVAEFEAVSLKRQLLTINERLMEVRSQADPIQTLLMDLPEDEHSMHRVLRQRMLALANYVASGRADP